MWATVEGIPTSTFFLILSCALIACAKGTEISPSEIVVIQPLTPQDGPDASADAAAPLDTAEPSPEAASGE